MLKRFLPVLLGFIGIAFYTPLLLAQENSVLSQGEWYKLAISQTGLHKLTYNDLKALGLSVETLDPTKIQIYGNGGGMLPQANNAIRYKDLTENAIWISGQQDGRFDPEDYIIFYAQGADTWTFDASKNRFIHEKNIYSDKNFYFLTISNNTPGIRIETQPSEPGGLQTISTFDDYLFHEKDFANILRQEGSGGSGREWYGELFNFQIEYPFNYSIDGIVPNTDLIFTSAVLAQSFREPTSFSITINGVSVATQVVAPIIEGTYNPKGAVSTEAYTLNTSQINNLSNLNINYFYNRGTSSKAYLNFFRLQFQRNLELYGNSTAFRSIKSLNQPISNFKVSNLSAQSRIWDITDPLHPKEQDYNLNGSTGTFGIQTTSLKEFIVWQGNDFSSPELMGKVNNQNLRAFATPNLLIITAPEFLEEAKQLAEFRKNHDKLSVQVATTQEVYHEFSSGKQDVTAIRDFARHLYLKSPTTLKYVLLFGDASFDYKDRVPKNTNFVPIYESRESLHPIYSYSSDDYFGFMDEEEGIWQETLANNSSLDHTMEIGVGRLPVKTPQEASVILEKLIQYSTSPLALGNWRKQIVFVADDGDNNQHQRDAEQISNKVESEFINYNVQKIFTDAYPQQLTPNGERTPICRDLLSRAIERGSLIVNYTGHGGEVGWTEELLFRDTDINSWKNAYKYPLMITATCEFGRYDEPDEFSGAEQALLANNKGAIALITTTRPVFSSTNFLVNNKVFENLFNKIDGQMPRLGDVTRLAKNTSLSGSINRNFALLGDPSMRLAYPQENIEITSVNNNSVTKDTLRALDKVTLKGVVKNQLNEIINDFNGVIDVIVFDKLSNKTTLGTEQSPVMSFQTRETLLFQGKASVKNGEFQVSFVVPKNIQYTFGEGKISFYAQSNNYHLDASGASDSFIVGGSNPAPTPDNTPPQITLFINDTTFVNGGLVGNSPILLARLFDENGINISEVGIGNSLVTYLNDSTENPRILNSYYTADLDTYQSGKVIYPFNRLPEGSYTLTLKSSDTYNNSSEEKIDFVIASDSKLVLQNVLNYPNPFWESTNFQLEHNRPGEELEISVQIFNSSGASLGIFNFDIPQAQARINQLSWNGEINGSKLSKGMYIYRIIVKSKKDNTTASTTSRLVIIR